MTKWIKYKISDQKEANEHWKNVFSLRGGVWFRGRFRGLSKFLSESNTFHIKSKAMKMLSCKNFATLLDPPLWLEQNKERFYWKRAVTFDIEVKLKRNFEDLSLIIFKIVLWIQTLENIKDTPQILIFR